MQRWLEGFAYRLERCIRVPRERALLARAIASLTVAAVASRAARAKPATALRYKYVTLEA